MNDNIYTENSIRTFTGKVFDLKIMDPESICVEDIAHALSLTARYGGHLPRLYSVAQHSVMVAQMVPKPFKKAALLHDASEAYMGDMPSPFKKMLPEFKELENKLMEIIASKFGFQFPFGEEIHCADSTSLKMEWNAFVLMQPSHLRYWAPKYAESQFLNYYYKYLND